MAAVASAAAAAAPQGDGAEDERPLTALPLFDSRFALYAFADGRVVGTDGASGAVLLKDPELPCFAQIFDPGSRQLDSVPCFDAGPTGAVATFMSKHLDTFVPAVIPGLARDWAALGKWDLDFFASACGDVDVQVTLPEGKRSSQRLGRYLSEVRMQGRSPQLQLPYLRGWYYERDCPWLAEDLWKPGDFHDVAFRDWFKRLPKQHHPDFHWLFLGAAGSVTPLHVDPTGTHAWLTQLSGRKRFVLFAPCDLPALLRARGSAGKGAFSPLEDALARGVPSLEVLLEPGDTLFVPAFWAHQVECVEDSVSLTWNFLGEKLFPLVRAAFLAHKVHMVAPQSDRDGSEQSGALGM